MTGGRFDPERLGTLSERVGDYAADLKRAVVEDDRSDVVEFAGDLWEVLDEVEDLLETLDYDELPEAVDLTDLPEAVDVDDVPEGLLNEEETAIELTNVREAADLRDLWQAVDVAQFVHEKRQLQSAVDDATDDADENRLLGGSEDDGLLGATDDEELFENVVGVDEGVREGLEGELRQAYLEERIVAAVEEFRAALLSTHDGLREVYRRNQEKLSGAGSRNPTATSTMPGGPLPDSASTRTSTVPSQVRYSRVENPRRVYGRRFDDRRRDEGGDR